MTYIIEAAGQALKDRVFLRASGKFARNQDKARAFDSAEEAESITHELNETHPKLTFRIIKVVRPKNLADIDAGFSEVMYGR